MKYSRAKIKKTFLDPAIEFGADLSTLTYQAIIEYMKENKLRLITREELHELYPKFMSQIPIEKIKEMQNEIPTRNKSN